MAKKEEEQGEVRVVDRRRFTAKGELRPDAERDESPREASSGPATPPSRESPQAGSVPPRASSPHPAAEKARQEYDQTEGEMAPPTFESLLVSLSTTATLQLGLVEDSDQAGIPVDLAGAKQTIDLLGMLEEKTRGNLSAREQQLLEQLLAELRMAYVQISRAGTGGPGSR